MRRHWATCSEFHFEMKCHKRQVTRRARGGAGRNGAGHWRCWVRAFINIAYKKDEKTREMEKRICNKGLLAAAKRKFHQSQNITNKYQLRY